MKLIPFNSNYLPPAFGFNNLGVTCYFNALVQSLLSCTSLTEVFVKNRNNPKLVSNPVAVVYLSIIDLFNDVKSMKSTLAKKNPELWYAMISYLRRKRLYMRFGNGQEDSHEAFIMLMQCWEDIDEVHILFEHTYHNNYLCFECKKHRFTFEQMNGKEYDFIKSEWKKKTRQIADKKSEYKLENDDGGWVISNTHFITTHDFKGENNFTNNSKINESKDLQDFINCQKSMHEGITCIHCGSKGDKLGYYTLAVIPEILVVVIKKYKFNKKSLHSAKLNVNTHLPQKLSFEKQDGGDVVYRPVSQILHSGGLEGGHYWAHTIRRVDEGAKWYDLNDTSVSVISDVQKFIPNVATYTVIYHLMP